MIPRNTRLFALAALSSIALLGAHVAPAAAAEKAEDGKSLVVPDEHASLGRVFHVVPGKPGANRDQIRFTNVPPKSKDKTDHFTGFTNSVIGYIVAPSESGDGAIEFAAGEFVLPVESLDTGIALRDRHIKQKKWLWDSKHPEIAFSLTAVENVSLEESTGETTTYSATLRGVMTIRGESQEIAIDARISHMPESAQTRAIAPGDLIAIRAQYKIVLSEFGVKNGIIGKKVADTITLEEFLVLSSEAPA